MMLLKDSLSWYAVNENYIKYCGIDCFMDKRGLGSIDGELCILFEAHKLTD